MRRTLWMMTLAACAPAVDPTTAGLVGLWANLDAGTWRVFEFRALGAELDNPALADQTDAYQLWFYADSTSPAAVQGGTYAVADATVVNLDTGAETMDDVLVTTVTWSADGSGIGATYGDPIYAMTADKVTIRSASAAGGQRVYDAVDALP